MRGEAPGLNPRAASFQGTTASSHPDLDSTTGTVLSHRESIRLFSKLGVKFTPELKGPDRGANHQLEDVFGSHEAYAQKMIDDYKDAGIAPHDVWAQSFSLGDIRYWIQNEAEFGRQAVYLDGRYAGRDAIDRSMATPRRSRRR